MEFEQIVKRLEWLDDEHRKDKASLAALEERIASLVGENKALKQQIKDVQKKVSEIGPVNARLSQFDELLSKERADMNKTIDELEKKHIRREKDSITRYQEGIKEVTASLPKLDQSKDILELKKLIKQRADEYIKLNVAVTELKPKIDDAVRKSQDVATSNRLIEESRRQDIKRVADIQGEITSVRKRVDEFRQKTELQSDSLRNIENRFTELILSEKDKVLKTFRELESEGIFNW